MFLLEIVVWVVLVFVPILKSAQSEAGVEMLASKASRIAPVQNDLTILLRVVHVALLARLTHPGVLIPSRKQYIDGLFSDARSLLSDIDQKKSFLSGKEQDFLKTINLQVTALNHELLLPALVGDLPREALLIDSSSLGLSDAMTRDIASLAHERGHLFGEKHFWELLEMGVVGLLLARIFSSLFSRKREEETYLRWASERTSDMVVIFSPNGEIRYLNPSFLAYLEGVMEASASSGRPDPVGKRLHDVSIHWPVFSRISSLWETVKRGGSETLEIPLPGKSDSLRWFSMRITGMTDEMFGIRGYETRLVDITRVKKSQAEMASQKEWLRITMNSIGDGVVAMNPAGMITFVNRVAENLLGMREAELLGRESASVLFVVQEESQERIELPLARVLRENVISTIPGSIALISGSGDAIPVTGSLAPIRNHLGEIVGAIFVFQESSERRKAQEALWNMKYHDQLTGLPNDTLFRERLTSLINLYPDTGKSLSVLAIGIDHFKKINDTWGHMAGNAFLEQFACRLSKILAPGDSLARLGGDEFLAVLSAPSAVDDISEKAREIQAEVRKPFVVSSHRISVTVSIGVSVFPDDGESGDLLIRNADIALNTVKERGRNHFRFYSPAMNANSKEELELRQDLLEALRQDGLDLFYQPKVNAATGRIVGMEALIRWNHAEKGWLRPHQFIRMAEEQGLIVSLGEWVLRQAATDGRIFCEGDPERTVSVNVSVRQLVEPDFFETVKRTLISTGLEPEQLILEVTESIFAREMVEIENNIRQVKAMGVKLSLDDFGTGFSSLANLTRFQADEIKVDKSFVDQMMVRTQEIELIRTMLSIGLTMGIRVVVEGVETASQRDFLYKQGARLFQGYFYSPPVAFKEMLRLMAQPFSPIAPSDGENDSGC